MARLYRADRAITAERGGGNHLATWRVVHGVVDSTAVGSRPVAARPARAADVEALFDARYPALCRLALFITDDRHLAEEIVMDAFLRVLTSWTRIRDVDRIDAYMHRAVVNLSRNALRRRRFEHRANSLAHARASAESHAPAEEYAEVEAVARAVRALPRRQRAAVVLRYYGDLTEVQVAAVLGCSVGTVKSQLAKARAALGRHLAAGEG